MTALPNGLHPVISRDRYDSIGRTNFSWLKLFAKSPAHARHALLTPAKDTDAKKVGRVVHVAAFEPERFRSSVAVWDGERRYGKDWEAFKARNPDKELLTVNEFDRCTEIQRAVRADATAMNYLQNGRGEVSLLWTATTMERGEEVECKGRIDFDAQTAIVDLKTTKDASPESFGRQFFALHYDGQAAWYHDAYFHATGIRKPYVIVAVENLEPFVVQVYRVPDLVLELGRVKYDGWLDQFAFCRSQSLWPGYSAGMELELSIPRWLVPDEDEDLSGLGLTSGGVPLAKED